MIEDIRSKPVLRLLSGLVCGVMLRKTDVGHSILLALLIILAAILWLQYSFKMVRRPDRAWMIGFLILTYYIVLGILLKSVTAIETQKEEGDHRGKYLARVLCYPLQKEMTFRAEVEILRNSYTNNINSHNNRVLVYFKNSDSLILPCISEVIIFSGELRTPETPENPSEFDYAAYLRSKGISFTCFLDPDDWIITGRDDRFSMEVLGLRIREKIWMRISSVQPYNPNLDILFALTLGSKDLLDKETKEAFISTGTMHVLAVSGLHVGLIYMVISAILLFLKRLPSGRILFFIIVFFLLWLYSLITGMCPSVVRSTIMFSLVILGKTIQKETSVYNSVFLASFISLLIMPSWLYDPGFQLSYSAVLAIVFFQPRISSAFSFKYRMVNWAWDLTAVSVAAQVGTLPISLYYFHRFPPYFLLANLIVIPLVTIILTFFIIQLISIFFPFVFTLISKLVMFLTGVLNGSVSIIGRFPSQGFENLFIHKDQMWLLIFLVLSFVFFLNYRKKHWIILNFILILFLLSIGNFRIWKRNTTDHFVVYKISQDFVAGMYSSGKGIILVSSDNPDNIQTKIDLKCSGFHGKYSISSHEIVLLDTFDKYNGEIIHAERLPGKNNYLCWFMDKKILLLNDPSYYNYRRSFGSIRADILVLGGKVKIGRESFINNFSCNMIIFSSSIPAYVNYDDYQCFSSEQAHYIHDTRISGSWMSTKVSDNQLFKRMENYLKSLGIL